jgi:6-phosphofructokinase 1
VFKPGEDPDGCKETDSGAWLKGEIKKRLKDVDCKYIDPSCEGGEGLGSDESRLICWAPHSTTPAITSTQSPLAPADLIRSIPATSDDRVYCKMLAHGALHAAFAGYTAVTVGQVNTHVVFLPLHLLAQAPRKVCRLPACNKAGLAAADITSNCA